jgi:hypothetical protein
LYKYAIVYYLNFVVVPHGVRGYFIDLVLPPCGWSTGFLATPRDLGALPCFKFEEAEVIVNLFESDNETLPKEPTENIDTIFFTPEGNFNSDRLVLGSILISFEEVPGLIDSLDPRPGRTSILLTCVCLGSCSTKKKPFWIFNDFFIISIKLKTFDLLKNKVFRKVKDRGLCDSAEGIIVVLPEPEKTVDDNTLL